MLVKLKLLSLKLPKMKKNNQVTVSQKNSTVYKLPVHILQRMEKGETFHSEDLKEYIVSEADIEKTADDPMCQVMGHSTITCTCRDSQGNTFTRTGNCDVYYANVNGQWQHCYTRCESCYVVCSK
jgi:hypothetical protein